MRRRGNRSARRRCRSPWSAPPSPQITPADANSGRRLPTNRAAKWWRLARQARPARAAFRVATTPAESSAGTQRDRTRQDPGRGPVAPSEGSPRHRSPLRGDRPRSDPSSTTQMNRRTRGTSLWQRRRRGRRIHMRPTAPAERRLPIEISCFRAASSAPS